MIKSREPLEKLVVEEDVLIIKVSGDIYARVGNIKNIDFPEEGDTVEKGDEIVHITGSEDELSLKAPIAGVVLEINELFSDNMVAHKEDKEHQEWIVKLEPQDPDDLFGFEE